MSRFFVGQRVRIVGLEYSGPSPHPKGLEGRIVEYGEMWPPSGISYDWSVTTDCGRSFLANSDELEPILPEGAAPSKYTFQQLMESLQEVLV